MTVRDPNRAVAVAFRADLADPRHGRGTNGYSNYGCRCGKCSAAWSAYCAARKRARRGALAPDDPRHGTVNGYFNWGCRCGPCCDARAEDWVRYNQGRRTA